MSTQSVQQLVEALRTETAKGAISPGVVSSILQQMLDYVDGADRALVASFTEDIQRALQVTQDEGQSTTMVMSQKAVTDLIGTLAQQVTGKLPVAARGATGGVAPLDSEGKVPLANLPQLVEVEQNRGNSNTAVMSQKAVTEDLVAMALQVDKKVDKSSVGQAGGVAPLDAEGKVPSANLPEVNVSNPKPGRPHVPQHIIRHALPEFPIPGTVYETDHIKINLSRKYPSWIGDGVVNIPRGELTNVPAVGTILASDHGFDKTHGRKIDYNLRLAQSGISVPFSQQDRGEPVCLYIFPAELNPERYGRRYVKVKHNRELKPVSKADLGLVTAPLGMPAPTIEELIDRADFKKEWYNTTETQSRERMGLGIGWSKPRLSSFRNLCEPRLQVQYGRWTRRRVHLDTTTSDPESGEEPMYVRQWRWSTIKTRIHKQVFGGKNHVQCFRSIRFRARYRTKNRVSDWTYFVAVIWRPEDQSAYCVRLFISDESGRFEMTDKPQPLWFE